MAVRVRCPNGHPLTVKDELEGKRVRCPKCKELFRAEETGGKKAPVKKPARRDDDDDDSDLESSSEMTPEDRRKQRQRDKRARLKQVSLGLLLHVIRTWTIVTWTFFFLLFLVFGAVGLASVANRGPQLAAVAVGFYGTMVMISGIMVVILWFIATIVGIIGSFFCYLIPRRSEANGLALATACFDIVGFLAVVAFVLSPFMTHDPLKLERLTYFLRIGGMVCAIASFFAFCIYLRKLAVFLKKTDIGTAAMNMLAGLIVTVISLPLLSVLTDFFMPMLYSSLGAAGALAATFFVVVGWFASFYYFWIYSMLRVLTALRNQIAEVT